MAGRVTQARMQESEATTGVGMLVHQFLLGDPDADLVKKAAPFLAGLAERPGREGRPPPSIATWPGR